MLKKVQLTIEKFNMAAPDDKILSALSGGADSVAMLLTLRELGFDVTAVHINHCLRGAESERDEAFCRELCERLTVPLYVRRFDVKGFAEKNHLGIEEAARQIRYRAFSELLSEIGGSTLATAHTLSDSCETILLNMTRGTGTKGLCGIPPVRYEGGIKIIRPLIEVTRSEVEAYLAEKKQSYVTDSSNLSDEYSRNKLRLHVIPLLREINPAFERNMLNMTRTLSADEEYFTSQLPPIDGGEIKDADQIPEPVLRRAVSRLLSSAGIYADYDKITALTELTRTGGKFGLTRELYAEVKGNSLKILSVIPPAAPFEAALSVGENQFLAGKIVTVSEISMKTFSQDSFVNKKFANEVLDCDKIQGTAVLRNRRAGDAVRFRGREHTAKLKKLFNAEIPAAERGSTAIIADEGGVIFVEGYGAAERVKPDSSSKRIFHITIKRSE